MARSQREKQLESRVAELEAALDEMRRRQPFQTRGDTVIVPPAFRPPFERAQDLVARYFADATADPTQANITISGDRYLLVRASSLSVEFLKTIKNLYVDQGDEKAFEIGQNFLFDIAHVIGVEDARRFHQQMGVTDPIDKLSAGPVLFAYCGWARVELSPESQPQPNDDYFIKYNHPYSFEADTWIQAGQKSECPVCIMNSGYSSGWCEESFGMPLTAVEISCRAAGDENCTFIMAPPHRIQEHLDRNARTSRRTSKPTYHVPTFFERKRTDEEMKRARAKAEESDRMKSEFIANISHEIRTPMNAIIGMTDLVLDSPLDATQRDYLNVVSESAEMLLCLINQILNFSKLESGSVELEKTNFDLREELGDTLKSLAIRAHQRNIELSWIVDRDLPVKYVADSLRLRQMIVNLVGNAIKFTQSGEVVVSVSEDETTESSPATRRLHFQVRDTGIGIPEQKLTSIFSAFHQADSSTTRKFGGTGLGLTITQQLAKAMGGRIWVDSVLGSGSTFHFTIQLEAIDEPKLKPMLPDSLSILAVVVGQQSTTLLSLKEAIEGWGFSFQSVSNIPAALRVIEQYMDSPDVRPVLICDVELSASELVELKAQVVYHTRRRSLPIIRLTQAVTPAQALGDVVLNASASLMKPVKHSELLDAILATLQDHAGLPIARLSPSSKVPKPPTKPLKILLAEDGVANQRMACALLNKWGHEVTLANNGKEAMDLLANTEFDLVFMDVQMPVMDGIEATRQIRALEKGSDQRTPIIAMTARAMKSDREECLAAGMDDFVTKPIRRHELERAISEQIPSESMFFQPSTRKPSTQPACGVPGANWQAAFAVSAKDCDLFNELVKVAIGDMTALLHRAQFAMQTEDMREIQNLAEAIRGAATTIAAVEIEILANELEATAHDCRFASCLKTMGQLNQAIDRLSRSYESSLAEPIL